MNRTTGSNGFFRSNGGNKIMASTLDKKADGEGFGTPIREDDEENHDMTVLLEGEEDRRRDLHRKK